VDVRELRREAVANDREALASTGHGDPAFRDGGRLVTALGVPRGGRLAAPADGSACQAGYIRVRGGTPFRLCESAQRSTERGGCMQAAIGDRLLIRGNCV